MRCVPIAFVIFADQECLRKLCPHAHPSLPHPQHSLARSMDLWCKDDLASQRAGSAVPKLRSRQTMAAVDSSPVHIRPHGMPAMMPPGWQDAAGPLKRTRAAATSAGPIGPPTRKRRAVLKPSLASKAPTTAASSGGGLQGGTNPFGEAHTGSSFSVMDPHTPHLYPSIYRHHDATTTPTSTTTTTTTTTPPPPPPLPPHHQHTLLHSRPPPAPRPHRTRSLSIGKAATTMAR